MVLTSRLQDNSIFTFFLNVSNNMNSILQLHAHTDEHVAGSGSD